MSTRKHPPRGEKRDYPKIDLYYDGHYKATTTWSRTCAEAKEHFHKAKLVVTGKDASLKFDSVYSAHYELD